MDVIKNNNPSISLNRIEIKEKFCPTLYNLNSEMSNNEKSLFDFMSNKKIKLNSYFDKKGTKKFLHDKKKAMEEIVLFDEIIDENKNRNTYHHHHQHHHHHHHKTKKNKFSYSKSEKKIYKMESHKSLKKKNNSNKVLKEKAGMHIIINYANDSNIKSKNSNSNVNKKQIKPLSSIASNFPKIKMNESFLNKNDSVIHSIVDEMAVIKS